LTMLTHAVSPDLESVAGAQGRLLDEVGVLAPETVGLEAALGRILAEPISSRTDLPGFDNSAMDGYAVRAGDVAHASADAPVRLQVVGESRAGAVPSAHVAGTAMRIMTGAPMPDGADTVVRQEDTTRDGGIVLIEVATPLATSVRPRGADIRAGDAVIQPGQQLTSIDIGVAAALPGSAQKMLRLPRPAFGSMRAESLFVAASLGRGVAALARRRRVTISSRAAP